MSMPNVTIGLPVYNGAAFIAIAIDSLLAQTYGDFELIISDNASEDATGEICERYARSDPRIRYVRQPENRGAYSNFGAVRAHARTDYFMWAAADDYWAPTFLERCVGVFDRDPGVGLVFTRYEILSRFLPLLRMRRFLDFSFLGSDDVVARVSTFIALDAATQKANAIYGLWRTDLLAEVSRMLDDQEALQYYGLDIAFLTCALIEARVHYIPDLLFFKTSKWLPNSSALDRMFAAALRMLRYVPTPTSGEMQESIARHVHLLRTCVTRCGADLATYEPAIQRWRTREFEKAGLSRLIAANS